MIDDLPEMIEWDEGGEGLLLGVAVDFALGQRLFLLVNLSLGEVGVVTEIQLL